MLSATLTERLENANARKYVRQDLAYWVLDNPELIPHLLHHCFELKSEISIKASWVLELVCLEKLDLLYPHFDEFFNTLPNVYRDQALRPFAKICEMIAKTYYTKKDFELLRTLKPAHKETMTECCFDWLITEQKVACEVFAMSTLYYLGIEIDWVHTELKTIINQNLNDRTPAYKSRGKRVLRQIRNFRMNN